MVFNIGHHNTSVHTYMHAMGKNNRDRVWKEKMRFFLIMYFFFTFVIISFSCIKYFLKMICIIGKSFYYMYFLYFPYIIRIHWPVLVIVNQKQIISRELPFVFLHWFSCGQKLNILMHFVFLWGCVFFLFCEYYYPIKIQLFTFK